MIKCQFCSNLLTSEQIQRHRKFCSRKCKSESQKRRVLTTCFGCGKNINLWPFQKHKINYCSSDCYHSSTKRKQIKTCQRCGKKFEVKAYLVEQGFGFFCSFECFQKSRQEKHVHLTCKQCEKLMERAPAFATKAVFCSKVCKDNFERDYVSKICKNCHKEFQLPTWETNKGKGTFCSRRCYIRFKGETSIEKIVRDYLTNKNISFDQEVHIGKYHADFQIKGTNLLIECDGSYWHNIPGAKEKDQKREEFLTDHGFQTIHLDEWEIKKSQGVCLSKFLKEI